MKKHQQKSIINNQNKPNVYLLRFAGDSSIIFWLTDFWNYKSKTGRKVNEEKKQGRRG
jgi:hypothetical protein